MEAGDARKSGCPGLPSSWLVHVAGLAWKAGMRYSLPKLSCWLRRRSGFLTIEHKFLLLGIRKLSATMDWEQSFAGEF